MSTSEPTRPRLSLRTPEDVISIVPYVIGFEPTGSLVVLGMTGKAISFGARIDLPADTNELPDYNNAVEHLAAVTAHNATACMLVGYGSAHIVTPVMDLARTAMADAGLPVREALRVTDNRYFSYVCDDPDCCPPDGKPAPGPGARIRAEAVLAGMATQPSRADLVASVAAHTGQRRDHMIRAIAQAARQLHRDLDTADTTTTTTTTTDAALALVRQRGTAAVDHAIEQHRAGRSLPDDLAASLLILLHNLTVRDHAMLRTEATDVPLWTDLTRRALNDLVASPATLLAYAAWLSGNGALANVALDRADAADPEYTMAHLLRQALHGGLHPSMFHDWLARAAARE